MSPIEFIQLVLRNKKWVIYFPLIVGAIVFVLTMNTAHTYTSDMTIYTGIASGFNPDNDFENKIDFHAVNSRFDNLINIIGSREIREKVAVKLIAFMLHNPDKMKTMVDNCKNATVTNTFTEDFIKKYKKTNEELTEEFLLAHLDTAKGADDLYLLVFGEKKNIFNVKVLADIKAERKGLSDMLNIEYTCEDPLTCKKTLDFTKELFLDKYKGMRVGEANQAVKYFKEQTAIAKEKLGVCEEKLKQFRSANRVINYYEQTKYIADQNEDIEKKISGLQQDLEGYRAALQRVEDKIGNRFLIALQSDKIVKTRDSLSTELNKLSLDAVKAGSEVANSPAIDKLKLDLKESVSKLYAINNTTEGVPSKKLLDQWVTLTVDKQEAQSKLAVLTGNKVQFDKVFEHFAPMGSELNKLEREVETAEKEYLNLLHNLNQAILRERNLEVSENISTIDDAVMPSVPNPGKRIILVIASILSCIVISVVLLIIQQYLDKSLASPLRLEELTGIKAGTAFLTKQGKNLAPTAITELDRRSLERWRISLNGHLEEGIPAGSLLIIPFNCEAEMTAEYVKQMDGFIDELGYGMGESYFNIADKIYPELLNKKVLEKTTMVYLFFDAAQKLDPYQTQIIDSWKKTGLDLKGILVNTSIPNISRYLGDIPMKRSKLRAFIKKQFKRYAS